MNLANKLRTAARSNVADGFTRCGEKKKGKANEYFLTILRWVL